MCYGLTKLYVICISDILALKEAKCVLRFDRKLRADRMDSIPGFMFLSSFFRFLWSLFEYDAQAFYFIFWLHHTVGDWFGCRWSIIADEMNYCSTYLDVSNCAPCFWRHFSASSNSCFRFCTCRPFDTVHDVVGEPKALFLDPVVYPESRNYNT